MPNLYRRLRRRFYHRLALGLLGAIRILPEAAGRDLCSRLVTFALKLRPRDAAVARGNLARAFPELDDKTVRRRMVDSAAALGGNFYDALTLDHWRARDYRGVVDDGAIERLAGLAGRGRGVLILTGHLGCWELLGGYLAHGLGGLTVVTGTIRNQPIDRLVNDWRRRAGMMTVPREGDLRPLLRALRDGQSVAVLMDQNSAVQNLDIPFFGEAAPTPRGFARLAIRYDVPILPVAIMRSGPGHKVVHQPPLWPKNYEGPEGEYRLLLDCNRSLETFIRSNPREWVWFHRRWREQGRT